MTADTAPSVVTVSAAIRWAVKARYVRSAEVALKDVHQKDRAAAVKNRLIQATPPDQNVPA